MLHRKSQETDTNKSIGSDIIPLAEMKTAHLVCKRTHKAIDTPSPALFPFSSNEKRETHFIRITQCCNVLKSRDLNALSLPCLNSMKTNLCTPSVWFVVNTGLKEGFG